MILSPTRRGLLPGALALAALAASTAAAQDGKPVSEPGHGTSFAIPDEVGGFRLKKQEELQPASLGTALSYEGPRRLRVDVYVYPTPRKDGCEPACDSVAVHGETDEYAGIIPEILRRGYFDSLRIALDEPVEASSAAGTLRGRHLLLAGVQNRRPVTSQFYLLGAGELLIKARATYPPDGATDASVDAFVRAFAGQAVQRITACVSGPSRTDPLSMQVTVPLPVDSVHARMEEILPRLGYAIDARDPRGHGWRTVPVNAWPEREVWNTVREGPHPGVQLLISARRSGRGTELSVGARTICSVEGARAGEGAVSLIAAMEVLGEFPEVEKKP